MRNALSKKTYGILPSKYIQECHLKKTKGLLLAGKTSKDVAEMVGFKEPLYFPKVFKKNMALPPSKYVKLWAGKQSL